MVRYCSFSPWAELLLDPCLDFSWGGDNCSGPEETQGQRKG